MKTTTSGDVGGVSAIKGERQVRNLFTAERQLLLEDMLGEIPRHEFDFLNLVGEYAAKELWPFDKYRIINDPEYARERELQPKEFGHEALKVVMAPLIDPNAIAVRGAFLPEKLGGHDISKPVYIMALEILGQANASVSISLAIDGSFLDTVASLGTEEQARRYVTDAIERKKMAAFAQTEPGHGTDVANLEARASIKDEFFVLSGQKSLITNGGWADYYFVVLRTGPNGKHGLSTWGNTHPECLCVVAYPAFEGHAFRRYVLLYFAVA